MGFQLLLTKPSLGLLKNHNFSWFYGKKSKFHDSRFKSTVNDVRLKKKAHKLRGAKVGFIFFVVVVIKSSVLRRSVIFTFFAFDNIMKHNVGHRSEFCG